MTGGFGLTDDVDSDIAAITAEEKKHSSISTRNNIKAQGGVRGHGKSQQQTNYSSKSNPGYSISATSGSGSIVDDYQYNQESYQVQNNNSNNSESIEKLIDLFSKTISVLKSIDNNTGRSSDALYGLTKASSNIISSNHPKKRSKGPMASSNNTNVTSVMSIVKPI
jgi:hypothetical protein